MPTNTYDAYSIDHDVKLPASKPGLGINLGYENDWNGVTPAIREECRQKRHILDTYRKGSTTRNVCDVCGYYWQTDSSD